MYAQHHSQASRSYRNGYRILSVLLLLTTLLLVGIPLRSAHAAGVDDLLSHVPPVNENTLDNKACAITAATMVLDYYLFQHDPTAQPLNITTVAQYIKEDYGYDPKTGKVISQGTRFDHLQTEFEDASAALESQLGASLQTALKTTDDANWFSVLTSELDAKRPVILAIPNGRALGWKWDFGHAIAVSGYTSDGSIIYHDPWDGRAHTLPKDAFAKAWGTSALGNGPWWYVQITPSTSHPAPPPDVTYIGSDGNVWDMTLPGGTPKQLTRDAQSNTYYSGLAWSPDGKRLAVLRTSYAQFPETYEMLILAPDGTVLRDISLHDQPYGRSFVWSPDGQYIADAEAPVNASGPSYFGTLYLFNSQTGAIEKTFKIDQPSGYCGDSDPSRLSTTLIGLDYQNMFTISWSPNQQTLLVSWSCFQESAQVDLASKNVLPGYPGGATYQPEGNLILGGWNDNSGSEVLGLADTSGQHVRVLASDSSQNTYEIPIGQAAWSSDGKSIYYEYHDSIWLVQVDGSNAHSLIRGTPYDSQGDATVEAAPQPSPDGKLLLYAQVQGGGYNSPSNSATWQWYVAQADGTNPTPIAASYSTDTSGSGGYEMVWRPGT